MRRTSLYFRPDERNAELIRIGSVYIARTSDRHRLYTSFLAEADALANAQAATGSDAMKRMLGDFGPMVAKVVLGVDFLHIETEDEIMESLFRLLPTNLKHDEIEPYPAEDFFTRAIHELNEDALKPEAVVESPESVCA
jgi:hypothetical protein